MGRVIPAAICQPQNRDALSTAAAVAKNDDFLRKYQGYGDITQVTWSGNSKYNALQVQVSRRYTHGFQIGGVYTYSKSYDSAADDTSDLSYPRPYKAFNYAHSDFDQPHILTIGYIWDVPSLSRHMNNNGVVKAVLDGWQISGTTSYATGRPKNNISASYTSGTATITAGQTCPAGTFQTSATVCTMITDFTGGTVNSRAYLTCDPTTGATGVDSTGSSYVITSAVVRRFRKISAICQETPSASRPSLTTTWRSSRTLNSASGAEYSFDGRCTTSSIIRTMMTSMAP